MVKNQYIFINRHNTLFLLSTLTLTLTFNTKRGLALKFLSFQKSITNLGIRTYEKRAEMDVILVEAECKDQYEGQICKKRMEAHYIQKQRRLDPISAITHVTAPLLDTQKSLKLKEPIGLQLDLRFGMARKPPDQSF